MPKTIINAPRPSAAIRAQYSRALVALLREMFADIAAEVKANYGPLAAEYAADAWPKPFADWLKGTFKKWDKKFAGFAETTARWFAKKSNASTTARLAGAMRDAGLTVKFKPSPKVAGLVDDIVATNVGLIKSIPQGLMTRVNDTIMESVMKGRDLAGITKELRKGYGITERRAVMIARDQTNKAAADINRARADEAGLKYGIWRHLGGVKVPRETHKNILDGQRFKMSEGLFDPDPEVQRMIQPGELVNCACDFRYDVSEILAGPGVAMDAKRGTARLDLPGATITWGTV